MGRMISGRMISATLAGPVKSVVRHPGAGPQSHFHAPAIRFASAPPPLAVQVAS